MICFNSNGCIILKEDIQQKDKQMLQNAIDMTIHKYDSDADYMNNDTTLIQYQLYANYHFNDFIIELLEDNIHLIDTAKLEFTCYDEEIHLTEDGFPFMIYVEVVDGKLKEQRLYRKLPTAWDVYRTDIDWFHKVNKEHRKHDRKQRRQRKFKQLLNKINPMYHIRKYCKRKKKQNSSESELPF